MRTLHTLMGKFTTPLRIPSIHKVATLCITESVEGGKVTRPPSEFVGWVPADASAKQVAIETREAFLISEQTSTRWREQVVDVVEPARFDQFE